MAGARAQQAAQDVAQETAQQPNQQAAQKLTQDLLARAHSPDSVRRIYTEKIQYRPLQLRPSSPPPAAVNARAARRRARQQSKADKKLRPRPLSAREQRRLGLHDIPKEGQKYDVYKPLNALWMGYAREVLGGEIHTGGPSAAAKLSSAELQGAEAEVVRCRCPGRVGIKGIVVRDRKFVLEIVTKNKGIKVIPKEGTTFRIEVCASEDETQSGSDNTFVFEVLGDQLMIRPVDRANRKFKSHFLKNV